MHSFLQNLSISQDSFLSGGVTLRSAPAAWTRFVWKTASIPPAEAHSSSDEIRVAVKGEEQKVLEVILNSFSLDPEWNDAFTGVEQSLRSAVSKLFLKEESLCLVVPKGNRFIGASLLDFSEGTTGRLVSGPVVLSEYRNRGIGSKLLHASLIALREKGVAEAAGVTRSKSQAAQHVYAKFGGLAGPLAHPFLAEKESA